jgi:hypothetical protein
MTSNKTIEKESCEERKEFGTGGMFARDNGIEDFI